MKQISYLVPLFFLVACCATRPEQADVNIAACVEDDKTLIAEYFTEPFDPVDFVRHLAGSGMDVFRVFPEPGIDFDHLIALSGKEARGKYYFAYQSQLYQKPINGDDEMLMKFQHMDLISRSLNPSYTLDFDISIKNNQSGELEHKKIKLDIRPSMTISDYRREGTLKFTLKKEADGSFLYGLYYVASAVVTQDSAEANLYNAFNTWLEQPKTTDFPGLLGELLKKKNY